MAEQTASRPGPWHVTELVDRLERELGRSAGDMPTPRSDAMDAIEPPD
jgi:hypothetical protein